MTPADIGIVVTAVALIAIVNWYFLGPKSDRVAVAASAAGPIDLTVLVEGGYSPATIEVPVGAQVRMTFDRRQDNPCSEEVVIPDFNIRRALPAHGKTTLEFTVTPGRHEFACGMGMLRGAIIGK
jgi:plastocyanin domain-containing protein